MILHAVNRTEFFSAPLCKLLLLSSFSYSLVVNCIHAASCSSSWAKRSCSQSSSQWKGFHNTAHSLPGKPSKAKRMKWNRSKCLQANSKLVSHRIMIDNLQLLRRMVLSIVAQLASGSTMQWHWSEKLDDILFSLQLYNGVESVCFALTAWIELLWFVFP